MKFLEPHSSIMHRTAELGGAEGQSSLPPPPPLYAADAVSYGVPRTYVGLPNPAKLMTIQVPVFNIGRDQSARTPLNRSRLLSILPPPPK